MSKHRDNNIINNDNDIEEDQEFNNMYDTQIEEKQEIKKQKYVETKPREPTGEEISLGLVSMRNQGRPMGQMVEYLKSFECTDMSLGCSKIPICSCKRVIKEFTYKNKKYLPKYE